jgi:phosphatidylserine/phosphatidylglycerophosphate/cardiolipin synthase-like enzyme
MEWRWETAIKRTSIRALPFLILLPLAAWFIHDATHEPIPAGEGPYLYATQCRQDLELLYKGAIDKAQQSIEFSIFTLTRPRIIDALNKAANRGCAVTLRYDAKEGRGLAKKLHPAIEQIPVKAKGLMHRKTLHIDDDLWLIGSANMTYESLRLHGNLVAAFRGHIRTWNLPEDPGALEQITEALDDAQQRLCIAMYTWTHKGLAERVIAAHDRGITVEVVIDGGTARGASRQIVEMLQQAGVEVRLSIGPELLHHKFVWIDNERLLCGSVNWTLGAFAKNEETLIELRGQNLSKLWRTIRCESR